MSHAIASAPVATIDVTVIAPVARHRLILGTFEQLKRDEGFDIVNDHDPRPLLHQLDARYSGELGWHYVEQGPDVWRVRVNRTG